jgi:hypothetical protein
VTDDLRTSLEQRLAVGRSHVAIHGLGMEATTGSRHGLALVRTALDRLADGGPYTQWIDESAVDAAADIEPAHDFASPAELCKTLCKRLQAHSVHVDRIDDDLERFTARLSVEVSERTGLNLPHLAASNPAYCRHFASSLSRAYSKVTRRIERFQDTAVLFVMGIPQCNGDTRGGIHAWNWLVDFEQGTVAAFDPQNVACGSNYANASSLLYTLAALRRRGEGIPGLRSLVRRHDSLHGGTILFHLARHPIDRDSRWKIASRLRATRFERVVPAWERELEAWDKVWRRTEWEIPADDITRFADD